MSSEVTFDFRAPYPLLRVNLVHDDAHLHPFSSGDGSAALRCSDTLVVGPQNVIEKIDQKYHK